MLQSDSINGGNLSVVKGNEDMQNMQIDTMHMIQSSTGNSFWKEEEKKKTDLALSTSLETPHIQQTLT